MPWQRRLSQLSFVIALGGFVWAMHFFDVFTTHERAVPDEAVGRTVRFEQHGGVWYVTASEQQQFDVWLRGSIGLGAISAALMFVAERRAQRSKII